MPKLNRSYTKKTPFRDARLFVIIAEGVREESYFGWFNAKNSRIQVLVIEQDGSGSAPNLLVRRLQMAQEEGKYLPDASDHVWFVCDVDRWRKQIEDLRIDCQQKPNWNLAVSNPCFEVWLHFHSGSLNANERVSCSQLKKELPKSKMGAFNTNKYAVMIKQAATNARRSDPNPDSFFPDRMQSKVYKLAESMLELLGASWR